MFGADEPDSSEPAKGLKEGVFQMWGKGCVGGEEEDGCREGGGKWWYLFIHCLFIFSYLFIYLFVVFNDILFLIYF